MNFRSIKYHGEEYLINMDQVHSIHTSEYKSPDKKENYYFLTFCYGQYEEDRFRFYSKEEREETIKFLFNNKNKVKE